MTKPKLEQVAAAMRFYAITFAPIGKQPVGADVERPPERTETSHAPRQPQPTKDSQ